MSDGDTSKRVLARFKAAMAVILRNVADHNWGWFSREDQRMHLQTVDEDAIKGPRKVRVWLENKGKRTFELSEGSLSGPQLKKLKARVDAERDQIEVHWVVFMIKNGWLKVQLKGRVVTLTAYPGTHNSFTREINLSREFPGAYPADPQFSWESRNVQADLDAEHCALAVGPEKNKDDREHILLTKVMFVD